VVQPAIAGRWEGAIAVQGIELTIIVELEGGDYPPPNPPQPSPEPSPGGGQGGEGLTGTIDIPQQAAAGIGLTDVSFEAGQLHFEMLSGSRRAVFDGKLQEDGTIAGDFKQAGFAGTFQLKRVEVQAEEKEPLPYIEEEVTFRNGDITLAGTLTLPPGNSPHPAVILISGSGPQNRNEELPGVMGYQPFRVIADHLTRNGIAVLRYDDRGAGKSTGEHNTATSADFATDVEAALDYLLGRQEINPTQIGLLGHSEGGLIAAMVAARNSPLEGGKEGGVAFVIAMAGTAVDGYNVLLVQNERILKASEATEEEVARGLEEARKAMDLMIAEDWAALEEFVYETGRKQLEALPEEQRKALGDPETYLQERIAEMMPFYQNWMHYFLTHDPAEDWVRVTVPVLALFGQLDTQVDVSQNRPALEAALKKAGNDDVTVVVFPTANHLFQDAKTGAPSEYADLPTEFVPGFLETITDWVVN
jgi:hypothetical protein